MKKFRLNDRRVHLSLILALLILMAVQLLAALSLQDIGKATCKSECISHSYHSGACQKPDENSGYYCKSWDDDYIGAIDCPKEQPNCCCMECDALEINCRDCLGEGFWNVGGRSGCCGDDASEFRVQSTSTGGSVAGLSACCRNSTDCAANGICYGLHSCVDVDKDGIKELCAEDNMWVEVNSKKEYCELCVGEGGWNLGGSACCGASRNEYIIETPLNVSGEGAMMSFSNKACCPSYSDCVYNGRCYSSSTCMNVVNKPDLEYCSYKAWYDVDKYPDSAACDTCVGEGLFRLGGWPSDNTHGGNGCCGDDENEYKVSTASELDNAVSGLNACCTSPLRCAAGNLCYNTGSCVDVSNDKGKDLCVEGSRWVEPDSDKSYCESCVGPDRWNLSGLSCGEGGATKCGVSCCGDDQSEYKVEGKEKLGFTVTEKSANDSIACCNSFNDCVAYNTCYSQGSCVDAYRNGNLDYCGVGNTWLNPDSSPDVCAGCFDLRHWKHGNCCGDDAGEFLLPRVCNGSGCASSPDDNACCESPQMCTANGKCYNSGITCTDTDNNGQQEICMNAQWHNPDENPEYCTACGYKYTQNKCCGDDGGEYFASRTCEESACASSVNDSACCSLNDSCVYNGACYQPRTLADINHDGANEFCDKEAWIATFSSADYNSCAIGDLSCPQEAVTGQLFTVSYKYFGTGPAKKFEIQSVWLGGTMDKCAYDTNAPEGVQEEGLALIQCPEKPGKYTITANCFASGNPDDRYCSLDYSDSKASCIVECRMKGAITTTTLQAGFGITSTTLEDTVLPNLKQVYPAENSTLPYNNVTFRCDVSDNVMVERLSLNVYGLNASIYKEARPVGSPKASMLFNTTLKEGDYSWNCVVCDTSANCEVGDRQHFTVDTTPPAILFEKPTPQNGTRGTANLIVVNASIYDSYSQVGTCILNWNGLDETMLASRQGRHISCYSIKPTGDGLTYTYQIFVSDAAGNIGESEIRVSRENIKPTFTSLDVSSRMTTRNQSISISTKGSMDFDGDARTLWCSDSRKNVLCQSINSFGEQSCSFRAPWNDSGLQRIYCWLKDPYETSNISEAILDLDNTPPEVSLLTPKDNSKLAVWFQNYACKASDNYGLANVSLLFNNATIQTNNRGFNGTYYFRMNLTDGKWQWTCRAVDGRGLVSEAAARRVDVDINAPAVSILYPPYNATLTVRSSNFTFTAADQNLVNVTFMTNITGRWKAAQYKAAKPLFEKTVQYSLANGTTPFSYYVFACDSFGNCGQSDVRVAYIGAFNNSLTPPHPPSK